MGSPDWSHIGLNSLICSQVQFSHYINIVFTVYIVLQDKCMRFISNNGRNLPKDLGAHKIAHKIK